MNSKPVDIRCGGCSIATGCGGWHMSHWMWRMAQGHWMWRIAHQGNIKELQSNSKRMLKQL